MEVGQPSAPETVYSNGAVHIPDPIPPSSLFPIVAFNADHEQLRIN